MKSICGMDCCGSCPRREACGGCVETAGRPFGGTCVAAECIKEGGFDAFLRLKNAVLDECNALGIRDLHVENLNLMNGSYINLEYRLANGQRVKLLEDERVYLASQVEIPGSGQCYGLAADENYLLVCQYGCDGANPQVVLYKKRQLPH